MGFASPAPVRAPFGVRLRGSPALTCAALASAPAALYVAVQPRVGDFAAQVYRSRLFGRMPFSIWDGNWYGGHHLPGYSVLFPPLGWLLGPALLAAIASVGAAAAFAALVDGQFGLAARPGGWWFATLGTASELFAGRLTFMVGLALALGSLLALQRERPEVSVALAVATSLASPVAALFLALAGAALALTRLGRRAGAPAAVAVAALLPALVLFTLFPEGGTEPLYMPYLVTTLGMTLAFGLLLPRGTPRGLPIAVAIYVAGTLAAYFLATPVGSNVARLGELVAGPLLACVLLDSRVSVATRAPLAAAVSAYALRRFGPWYELGAIVGAALLLLGLMRRRTAPLWTAGVLVGLAPFAIWQWSQTAVDLDHASDDAATRAAYFRPLLHFLDSADRPRVWRVEVLPMREHWESVEVADRFPLARGWERQLDKRDAPLFYQPHAWRRYRRWLEANDVRFVAVPDAPLDYPEWRELAAIRYRAPFLRRVWRSAHWQVFQLSPAPTLVLPAPGASISARELDPQRVALLARTRGSALVRVRYTRYWRLDGGCVSRDGDWTRVDATRTGRLSLSISVTPGRLLPWTGARCS